MAEFHLTKTDNVENYSIKQGASFALPIKYLGVDYSLWTPRGQIRKKYADQIEDVLAVFSFEDIVYNEIDNFTRLIAILTPEQTRSLPIPSQKRKNSRDQVLVGVNVWVYDIELESPEGEVIRDPFGYVEVLPEVTR